MSVDILDEISRFDGDYKPEEGRKADLSVLPDGVYDFEIVNAAFDRTQQTRDAIVRLIVKPLGGALAGTECETAWFMGKQEDLNRIGGKLAVLGFDTDRWHPPQRPFSRELAAALPRMKGLKFRGKKSANVGTSGKTYQNLDFLGLLKGTSAPPAAAVAPPSSSVPAPTQPSRPTGDCPF